MRPESGRPEIKAEALRELALEVAQPPADIGIRAGIDAHHPTYRGRAVVSFAVWDLLGMQRTPEALAGFIRGVEEFGVAGNVARLSGGTTPALLQSEARIARFFAQESGLLFSTRTQCVLTTLTALCSEGVVVMGAPLTPLPLGDASALVGAEFVEFDGVEQLRSALHKHALAKRIVVVIDGVAGISGEVAPIAHLLTAIEHVGAWAIIDETSGLGWSGMRGAGSAEVAPSSPAIIGRVVGFQGVAGVEECALVCSKELRELLLVRSRYLRQEPPPNAPVCRFIDGILNAVEVALPQRDKLRTRAVMVAKEVRSQGWSVLSDDESPILSLWFESLHKARGAQEALLQRGVLVEALAARSIRRNGAVLRALISNNHTQEEVLLLLSSLDEVKKRLERDISSL